MKPYTIICFVKCKLNDINSIHLVLLQLNFLIIEKLVNIISQQEQWHYFCSHLGHLCCPHTTDPSLCAPHSSGIGVLTLFQD